jgi:DNA adenine methylase
MTLLRYPGGKSKNADYLVSLFPIGTKGIVEPFCGGANVSLCFARSGGKGWINDLDECLINFWNAVKNKPECLVKAIKHAFSANRNNMQKITTMSDECLIGDAAIYYLQNQIAFSGRIGSFSHSAARRFNTKKLHEKIFTASKLFSSANITNLDYAEILKNRNTFLFLDPPYYNAGNLYRINRNKSQSFNHHRLFDALLKYKGQFLMTYDNSEYIKSLYKDFYVYRWETNYCFRSKKHDGNQVIISNYRIEKLCIAKQEQAHFVWSE